jgi:nucleotide-binding universal stress UspA family protein
MAEHGPAAESWPFRSLLLAVAPRKPGGPVPARLWQLARSSGSHLTICHVVMRPTSSAGNETDGTPANAEETRIVRELRAEAVGHLGERGRSTPILILHGDPGQRICEYADFADCDLIVLGPRERGSLAKALRGSVSRYVVANSRRNVLVLGN